MVNKHLLRYTYIYRYICICIYTIHLNPTSVWVEIPHCREREGRRKSRRLECILLSDCFISADKNSHVSVVLLQIKPSLGDVHVLPCSVSLLYTFLWKDCKIEPFNMYFDLVMDDDLKGECCAALGTEREWKQIPLSCHEPQPGDGGGGDGGEGQGVVLLALQHQPGTWTWPGGRSPWNSKVALIMPICEDHISQDDTCRCTMSDRAISDVLASVLGK